ncbi:MAG: hypothetical protein J7K00_05525 [Candidatus Diapherotrites archaeon]|nr:hypothetical protein [Candidatus Diapherotrites archaeon]
MNDTQLNQIGLTASVIGLVLLFVFSTQTVPEKTKLSDLQEMPLGSTVLTKGYIKSSYVSQNNNLFLKIVEGSASIDVVMFERTYSKYKTLNENNPVSLAKGKLAVVCGKLTEYEGKNEIIINSPDCLKII